MHFLPIELFKLNLKTCNDAYKKILRRLNMGFVSGAGETVVRGLNSFS